MGTIITTFLIGATLVYFLQKDRTKKIISLLEKGKSVRDISHRLGASTKTIVKVRKYVEI